MPLKAFSLVPLEPILIGVVDRMGSACQQLTALLPKRRGGASPQSPHQGGGHGIAQQSRLAVAEGIDRLPRHHFKIAENGDGAEALGG